MRRLAVIALALLACHRNVTAPPAALDAGSVAKIARAVRVTDVRGRVVKLTRDGKKAAVAAGEELAGDDVLTTEDGSARLDVGGVADVEVAPGTQVAVGELTDELSKVKLRDGRIAAVVHGEARRTLEVDVPGSSATATASQGEFSMLASGSQLSVAAKAGQVTLSARGRSVRIGSGQLSIVERGEAPTAPQPLPPSLFLKLGAAAPTTTRLKTTTVRGTTVPGAVVSVNGVKLAAGADGAFATTVPLKEGANKIIVDSTDALGRRQSAEWPRITVDTRAPEAKTKVEW